MMSHASKRRHDSRPERMAPSGGWPTLICRILFIIAGGYFVSTSLVAAFSVTLTFIGLHRSEGAVLASMSGFVIYLVLLIWGFAQPSLMRLGVVFLLLAGGGQALSILLPRVGG